MDDLLCRGGGRRLVAGRPAAVGVALDASRRSGGGHLRAPASPIEDAVPRRGGSWRRRTIPLAVDRPVDPRRVKAFPGRQRARRPALHVRRDTAIGPPSPGPRRRHGPATNSPIERDPGPRETIDVGLRRRRRRCRPGFRTGCVCARRDAVASPGFVVGRQSMRVPRVVTRATDGRSVDIPQGSPRIRYPRPPYCMTLMPSA